MITTRTLTAFALSGLLLAACSTSPELSASVETGSEPASTEIESSSWATSGSGEYAPEGQPYTLVVTSIVDPSAVPSPAEMLAISSEQGAFVDWLFVNGGLVAAGPVVPPRGDSNIRQLMFFATDNSDEALEHCCEGPANSTGLYGTEASSFVTTCDLPAVGDSVLSGTGNALRPYVIVTGPSSAAMTATFGQMGNLVLCQGSCTGGMFDGRCLGILDCTDLEDAYLFMGEACSDTSELGYHVWIGPVAFSTMR